jgi:hypothetical protein
MEKSKYKKACAFRLSDEAIDIIDTFSANQGLPRSAIVELAVRMYSRENRSLLQEFNHE